MTKTIKQKLSPNYITGSLLSRIMVAVFMLSIFASASFASIVQAAPYDITEFESITEDMETLGITAGHDGNLWFTAYEYNAEHKIGKVTPSGVITEYEMGPGEPGGIAAGPDGNVWFLSNQSKIAKITPSGVITEYEIEDGEYRSGQITTGTDGNLWLVGTESTKIAKITPSGVITEYDIPNGGTGFGITTGPDGNVWFTEGPGKVAKITPSGVITEYDIPNGEIGVGITTGPDGNLWYTNISGKIGKVTTSGVFTEYDIPTEDSLPFAIASGSDGNLWFIGDGSNKIGKVTTSGVFTEYDIPTEGTESFGITSGPDDNIWFTEGNNKIGRIELPSEDGGGEEEEPLFPNEGDANNDGLQDDEQDNVSTFISPQTGKYVSLEVDGDCIIDAATVGSESTNAAQDAGYSYSHGLMDFTIDCGTPGFESTVKQFYYGIANTDGLVARKFKPSSGYFSLTSAHGVNIEKATIGNQPVAVLSYQVVDGQELDIDGQQDGIIKDPVGLGSLAVGSPNTGLADTANHISYLLLISLAVITSGSAVAFYRQKSLRHQ